MFRPVQTYFRQYWDENLDQEKKYACWKTTNNYAMKECQKPSDVSQDFTVTEDIGIPLPDSSKKKKSGASDPRFKRVINTELRSDTDIEAEKLAPSQNAPREYQANQAKFAYQANENRISNEKVISFLKTPNDMSFLTSSILKKLDNRKKNSQHELSDEVTKDTGFQVLDKQSVGYDMKAYRCGDTQKVPNCETLKNLENVKSNFKTSLKRSMSDCTLETKKDIGGENDDEICEKLRAYLSATRLLKVHNWIKDYNCGKPEKRRSVITVIGQTQTKPVSKILNEINQRRMLAKELDKHALCEAIMNSSDNQSEVKNLVAKVDLVLPDGKVIYSTEKVYLCKDNKFTNAGVYSQSSMEILDAGDQRRKRFEMIPEKDSSVNQMGRKIKMKYSGKKVVPPLKKRLRVRGNMKTICENVSDIIIWSFFAFTCLGLCISFYFYSVKPSPTFFLAEFFKPKTAAWYEKLLF